MDERSFRRWWAAISPDSGGSEKRWPALGVFYGGFNANGS